MLTRAFARGAVKNKGLSSDDLINAVLRARPDLEGQLAYVPTQGFCALTVFIGDEVFKVAKTDPEWTAKQRDYYGTAIERERYILKRLAGRGLPVPEVTCEGQDPAFYGMTRMTGHPLQPENVWKMSKEEQQSLAHELVLFCTGLSAAITVDEAIDEGFDRPAPHTSFTPDDLRAALQNPVVRAGLQEHLDFYTRATEKYIALYERHQQEGRRLFMHCDMHPANILYDPKTKKLAAILDFGLSRPVYPMEGLAALYMNYPSDFMEKVLGDYSAQQGCAVTMDDMKLWYCASVVNRAQDLATEQPKNWQQRMYSFATHVWKEVEGWKSPKRPGPALAV